MALGRLEVSLDVPDHSRGGQETIPDHQRKDDAGDEQATIEEWR